MVNGERESVARDFLESSCLILHEAQVWPPTHEQISFELCAAYNYVVVKCNSLLCQYHEVSSTFDSSKTDKVIAASLKRVYNCICNDGLTSNPSLMEDKCNETISHQMLNIVKVLENPIFHFKSLSLLGRLLMLVSAGCLYKQLNDGYSNDAVSCFIKLTEMASVPVLKEKCHFYHGLLLASPSPKDRKEEKEVLFVEDVICLFLVTFQRPCHHLVIEHQSWKWLFTAMECRHLIQEKSFTLALPKLQTSLKECLEPNQKCRLLCLFADCYFHLGCPQLAIQTYRDALHVDSKCFSILYHLSLIYQSQNEPDLELESLNLCVMALADDRQREKKRIPILDLDELIWSVFPPTPPVSFLMAKITFAKRCRQLQRYQEAAEQYSSLVQMLQQENIFLEIEHLENNQEINIAEILVDAAEVLLITQQFQECIKICNQTQPSLLAQDALTQNSQEDSVSTPNILSLNNSQSDFFHDIVSHSNSENLDPSFSPREKMRMSKKGDESAMDLHASFERSRKRLRSNECENEESSSEIENTEDILMTRLLLCKTDALVLSTGFTDRAVNCLQQALDVLLCHPVSTHSKKEQPFSDMTDVQIPHSKRQRISSDGKVSSLQSNGDETHSSRPQNTWSKLLIDTALRMANASWKRKRFPSVINSCRVVEQLTNDNMDALYLKTQVFSEENNALRRETISKWLNKRGVNYFVDRKTLEETIQKLQQDNLSSESSSTNWWSFSQKDFLELDVKCLESLLNIQRMK